MFILPDIRFDGYLNIFSNLFLAWRFTGANIGEGWNECTSKGGRNITEVSLLYVLLIIPIIGIFLISTIHSFYPVTIVPRMKSLKTEEGQQRMYLYFSEGNVDKKENSFFAAGAVSFYKKIALITTILNLIVSLIIYMLFDFSNNQFQFIQENLDLSFYDIYLGVDGISIYFVLLTTIIMPIALVSNWNSIIYNMKSYLIIILLLETLLLAVFLVLDVLLFYIFFESILPPLFILIGLFGSSNKVRASFYIFLYTFILKCKRAKYRGSPKALVTKVVKETLQLAWLMTQDVVKSLVDIWGITVLNHPCLCVECKQQGVKEQRVDGSSSSRNLEFVRCTLVAGKPVLGRKIHHWPWGPVSSKLVKVQGDYNITTQATHRLIHSSSTLDPWFVTGFVDAEGCFIIGLTKSEQYRLGYQVTAIFKISLHRKDSDLLCQIRDFFGVGVITKHGETTLQYMVRSIKDLNVILSHFDAYPLISQKWSDYKLFKQAVVLIKNKEHLTKQGLKKIFSLRASINLGLSDELQLVFPDIVPAARPLPVDLKIKNFNYIAGLTSGDGCFFVSIRNSSYTVSGKSLVLKFQIVQHSRDVELMEMLISTLGCGRIELALKQSAVYYVVTKYQDILEKLIPLFDNYPIKGVKALDYSDFKKIVFLMKDKAHLTEQGLMEIQSIKLNMNLLRSRKLAKNS